MLVFGTQMNLVTFIFVSIEVVIFFYLIIIRLARPDDQTVLLNITLIFLLLTYNISGGLLPDPKLPGSGFLQLAAAYATGFITPCYFPYYVYKAFGLTRLKFQAYVGAYLFLIIPYLLFVVVFVWSGDIKMAQILFIFPVLYGVWLINMLFRSIQYKYNNSLRSKESRQELTVLLLSIAPWVSLPVIAVLEWGQAIEASVTNLGFLLLFSLQVKRNIKQIRIEHERLIKSEMRLRTLNDNLQNEVKKRTQELEKANQLRTKNFINLVHETKTPLTLVKNYLDEYINKYGSAEELNVIKGGIDKLTADVINLFDIERFSKGIEVYMHNKVSDFSQILKGSLPLFEYYCAKQNITSNTFVEDDLVVKADPNAINRIVNNIIENAIKFTDPGGEITISLSPKNGKIIFSVQDNGVGIPPSLHKKIFEPYYQIGNKNTSLQGMGLGLPIVKRVVDSLNGEIVIKSNPAQGPGTKVVISLTRHDSKAGESSVQTVKEPSASYYQLSDYQIEDGPFSPKNDLFCWWKTTKPCFIFIQQAESKVQRLLCDECIDALKKLNELPAIRI